MARPDKVAAVEEIGEKLSASTAAVLTEYRGLTVPDLAQLRAALREANTQYKVYKNTLARRAVEGQYDELVDLLEGPVAWAFVDGDVVSAAKAIREFSKTNDNLVIKGGLLDGAFISAEQVDELAQLPTRDELLAKLAGGFKAPLAKAAGLFSALQRNTAYAIKALIDKRVEGGEEAPPEDADDAAEAPAADESDSAAEADAPAADESDSAAEDDAPAADESDSAAEADASAEEAAEEAADDKSEEAASPEADTEDVAQDKESGTESAANADDDSEAEGAPDGSAADESAADVSDDAPEAEAEEKADDADSGQEAEETS